jgi:pRiA4b ORF-3-like protein
VRAVHDRDERELGMDSAPADEDDLPGYRALAVLVRARMNTLPAPTKPPVPHGAGDGHRSGWPTAAGMVARPPRSGATVATLPAKRRSSGGPVPVYQIKVELRGAKPPIWRRLEVPADISLARLHAVIQTAFGWCDSHLHVFQTPYGEFGVADAELVIARRSR